MVRFLNAFDYLNRENSFLRLISAFVIFVCASSILVSSWLIFRPPLLIERGCESSFLKLADANPTDSEIKAFLKSALSQRFDSEARSVNYLNQAQVSFREAEQSELRKANMSQIILVRKIKEEDDHFVLEADRLIAVGNLRSALRFNIKVKLHQTLRSKENPYGLMLDEADPIRDQKQ